MTKTIEAVVKLTERCNIDCTYCYVFNLGDTSYKEHPAYLHSDMAANFASFLAAGARDVNADQVIVDFHGGEPLLMKKSRFIAVCEEINRQVQPHAAVKFCVQTNAMLIDNEWIDIFDRFQVTVGVSLDGPKEINDLQRVDHNGKGTYDRTIRGLRLLKQAHRRGKIPGLGVLSVASASHDGAEAYRHIAVGLGISYMDFLLPIDSHDSFDHKNSKAYGKFLIAAFDAWLEQDDPVNEVRIIRNTIAFLSRSERDAPRPQTADDWDHIVLTVASNGDLGPDDSMRTVNIELFNTYNIATTSFVDYIRSPHIRALIAAEHTISADCEECCWQNVCRGGAANGRMVNRYSERSGFNNASVACEGLQDFYGHVSAALLKKGLPFSTLEKNLVTDETFVTYPSACEFRVGGNLGKLKAQKLIPIATTQQSNPAR